MIISIALSIILANPDYTVTRHCDDSHADCVVNCSNRVEYLLI